MAAPFTAPRTSFNGTITGRRSIAFADMALDDIKAIKNAIRDHRQRRRAGALRRRAAALPRGARRAPSTLAPRHRPGLGARGVAALAGRQQGLRAVRASSAPTSRTRSSGSQELAEGNRNAKDHHNAISADALQDWAEFAAPRTFGLAVRALLRPAARREAPGRAQPGDLQRARTAGADLLHGRPDRGALPARPGLPRRRSQHHRDVEQRPAARRDHRLPRVDAGRRRPRPPLPAGAREAQGRRRVSGRPRRPGSALPPARRARARTGLRADSPGTPTWLGGRGRAPHFSPPARKHRLSPRRSRAGGR